jgi:hypothetical protein
VDSNLHAFHPWGHLKTDTITCAAGVLVMQAHFRRYYYASSGFTYDDQVELGRRYKDVSVGDYFAPMLSPLLSTESLDFIIDGMQYSRTEKTIRIMNYEPVFRFLNVCVSWLEPGAKNCSTCTKCSRTLMTLSSIGKIDEFSELFDVAKYRRKAARKYVSRQVLLAKRDAFARDNIALAKANGVLLPPATLCAVYLLPEQLTWLLKKAAKTVLPKPLYDQVKQFSQRAKRLR